MNLLGESFPKEIIEQIKQRQKIFGSGYGSLRDIDQISYLNSNSAWCKLISSVKIPDPNKAVNFPKGFENFNGNELAKRYILFNGTNNAEGINFTNNLTSLTAYGIGGNQRGVNPMMGITSVDIQNLNSGALRKAQINLKAWNKIQFQIIDCLYLKLGFSILLEWGHSIYVDNNGKIEKQNLFSLQNRFLEGNLTYLEFLDLIKEQRLKSGGNYDAMLARISNFHWNLNPNGSYDITIDLISMGDIIESLNINKSSSGEGEGGLLETEIKKFEGDEDSYFKNRGFKKEFNGDEYHYIRFQALLMFLEENIIYDLEKTGKKKEKIIKIDKDIESNLMYLHPYQVSFDPKTCLVLRKVKTPLNKIYEISSDVISDDFEDKEFKLGKIMNIYLNTEYVKSTLNSLKTEKNKIFLTSFLQRIISDVNKALGGINNLEVFIDEDPNSIKIIDKTPLSSEITTSLLKKFGLNDESDDDLFEVFGSNYSPSGEKFTAGFISNLSLKTELSPELASMITIGAAANNEVVGEDATAISRLNYGYEDVYKELITEPEPEVKNKSNTNTSSTEEETKKAKEAENKTYVDYFKYLILLSEGKFDEEKDNSSILTNYITAKQSQINRTKLKLTENLPAKEKPIPIGNGFIPFNLSFDFKGLSGIKVNSRFKIATGYLPSQYPDTVEFLVRGLTHKIENNKWITSIESYSIVKGKLFYEEISSPNSPPGTNINSKISPSVASKSGTGVIANLLRNWIKQNTPNIKEKSDKDGLVLDSRGDITNDLYKAVTTVFANIPKDITLTITAGNDLFHTANRHINGRALDFTVFPNTEVNKDRVESVLKRVMAANKPNFRYLNEYKNPSIHATGQHFHISWGEGTEGLSNVNSLKIDKNKVLTEVAGIKKWEDTIKIV